MEDERIWKQSYSYLIDTLVTCGLGVYSALKIRCYNKYVRSTKNLQVMSLQSFMRGYGLSLAATSSIIELPLSSHFNIVNLDTRLLTLARAKIEPDGIDKLDPSIISKGMSSYGYIYSMVYSCFLNACYSEKTRKINLSSEIIEENTDIITKLFASEVSSDPAFLSFEVIIEAIIEEMFERNISRKTLVRRLEKPYRSRIDYLLGGEQTSCGADFVSEIAAALGTTASYIYRKAEAITKREKNGEKQTEDDSNTVVIPPVTGTNPQAVCRFSPSRIGIPSVRKRIKADGEESVILSILDFCSVPRTLLDIGDMLGYSDKKTIRKYVKPLVTSGRLRMTIPGKPSSCSQKYVAVKPEDIPLEGNP